MMTVAQALQSFLSSLELTEAQREKASNQHTYLRTQLQQRLAVDDNFLSGSYSRGTAIRPLNDIDVFVVLNSDKNAALLRANPADTLKLIQSTLSAIYPDKTTRRQARSVNIAFTGTDIAYDVVPAFRVNSEVYRIPDADGGRWISTNPRVHKERSTAANERAGKKLKPLTKAAKHWNARNGKPLRSFHLEVMAWEALSADPGTYLDGLARLFSGLRDRVLSPCPEPAGLGPNLEIGAPDRGAARQKLAEASELATQARDLANSGRTAQAHKLLRELLGPDYPEKGSAAVVVPSAPAAQAVDAPAKRFG